MVWIRVEGETSTLLKEIEGFPDYKISDDGRVWSEKTSKWMKGTLDAKGYLVVQLSVNGKRYVKKMHRLVAKAFIPNPNNLPEVNHKDEDKTNNSVTNLEWCDRKYNNNYGTRNKRANPKMKTTKQRIYGKAVAQMTLDGEEVAMYCCANEAARQTGFAVSGISKACLGGLKTYRGYRWKYAES